MDKIWLERKFIDTWSLNHFLFGASLPLVMQKFGFNFWPSFLGAIAIFILWEIIEIFTHEHEEKYNGLFDVIVAMIGFLCFWLVQNVWALLLVIFTFSALEVFGYGVRIASRFERWRKMISVICILTTLAYLIFYVFALKSL
jgi:L-asparagine transporter-like permease